MLLIDEEVIRTCCFTTKPSQGYRINWQITSLCNWACKFCFLTPSLPDLRTREVIDIIDIIRNSNINVSDILLGGREPLVRKDIEIVVRHIYESNLKLSISTNGSNIESLRRLMRYSEAIRAVNLSVFSHKPLLNDRISGTGSGTLQGIQESVDCLHSNGVDIKINIPLSGFNIKELDKALAYVAKLGVHKVSLSPILYLEEHPKNTCTKTNILDLSNTNYYTELTKACEEHNMVVVPVRIRLLKTQKWLESCPSGTKILSILSDGTIVPCNLMPKDSIYNSGGFSFNALTSDFAERIEYLHRTFSMENLSIQQDIGKVSSQLLRIGGGCRAVISSESKTNGNHSRFEHFFEYLRTEPENLRDSTLKNHHDCIYQFSESEMY